MCELSVGDERLQNEREAGTRRNENELTDDPKMWGTNCTHSDTIGTNIGFRRS